MANPPLSPAQFLTNLLTAVHELTGRRPPPTWTHVDKVQRKLGSDNQKRQWRRDANTYLECYKKYVEDQRALAQRYQDAANAAIEEYNTAVKNMQAQIDAAAQQ